uniref:RING-type E3 ubiquitin transferase n=1 Tax=Panagrellus redivivus TaxID=6233 RepID=A0A7E4VEM8_PANRE
MTAKKLPDEADSGGVDLALNRFERIRGAHATGDPGLTDNLDGGIMLERFRAELSCKLCHNVMKDPVLSRSCKHRFCSLCVIENGKVIVNTCPVCQANFTGEKAFSVDDNFSQLIQKLLPINNDIGRRTIYSTLKANGADVKNLSKNAKLPEEDKPDRWGLANIPQDTPTSSVIPPHIPKSELRPLQAEDIIHLKFENGSITLTYMQLDLLPFRLRPGSLRRKPSKDLTAQHAYSICGSHNATFTAEVVDAFVPEQCEKDVKALILLLPAFALCLFPSTFVADLLKERETLPDAPVITLKQQINYGLVVGVILFPDTSVSQFKHAPKQLKRPRCIYITPFATVDHLCQFLIKRSQVETKVKFPPFDVKFSTVLDEKQRLTLRMSPVLKQHSVAKLIGDKKDVYMNLAAPTDTPIPMLNTLVVVKHPFEALHPKIKIKNLLYTSNIHGRPLKLIFKFVSRAKCV